MVNIVKLFIVCFFSLIGNSPVCTNGIEPKSLMVYRGNTPVIDGIISEGEYDDAMLFEGFADWSHEINPVKLKTDLSLKAWVKHDGKDLYFAFRVFDDVIYGIDIPRWLPANDSSIHDFSRNSWPWFGDGLELFLSAADDSHKGPGDRVQGNGFGWQMVCSSHKSYLNRLKAGGLVEGNPRNAAAWGTYERWIKDSAMVAAVNVIQDSFHHGYIIEWKISANPCLQLTENDYWKPSRGAVSMKFDIEVQDLDVPGNDMGNIHKYHHIELWSGSNKDKDLISKWGNLVLLPGHKP